ncbi:MAG: glutamine-synthetase adenylyltransferase [Shimia sp.]
MDFAARITRWPEPFEPAGAPFGTGPLGDLLRGAAGSSPYLAGLLGAHAGWLEQALEDPETAMRAMCGAGVGDLRTAKARAALLIALADLGGVWTLEEVTTALTRFADAATETALTAAQAPLIARGKLPEAPGLTTLAMGKMGAHELNYSSDIDLILLFDAERHGEHAGEVRRHLIAAARTAMATLSKVTAEGYVFRTDLRLRPDASVTPIVLATSAAERYYESVGRTWERAAFIKARPCAGDLPVGRGFLDALTPFIWRRHLDFAAIEDAHDIRQRIQAHKGLHGAITLPGHDMKLGRGGIREIEFFTQTRQLIAGGRDPAQRARGTVPALAALAQAGWIEPAIAETLTTIYRRHREVEHRLQMLRDAQTHALPSTDTGFDRLAAFMGVERAALETQLRRDLTAVRDITEPFFSPPKRTTEAPAFGEETASRWPTYPALRTDRARTLFARIQALILTRLSQADRPDAALAAFDNFLRGLPAGVQVFSLFDANPQLVDLLVDIASAAPALAEYLGRNSAVLDAVIGGDFFIPWPGCAALTEDLARTLAPAPDYETKLDTARAWHRDWHFRIGVHALRGLTDAPEMGSQYADLAEATLAALWPIVTSEHARKHGPPPGRGAVVLGMGSLGARRLHARSDLDLIVIYDAEGQEASDGPRPLATRPYYARLTQALVTALTARMPRGQLYEVDLRLRPSGRNGPVATSLPGFLTYQQEEAWTWEHLALTRARVVAGDPALARDVEAARCTVLALPRDRAKIAADVADMRRRLSAAKPGAGGLSAKNGPGRLLDVELFAQTAALLAGETGQAVADQLAHTPRDLPGHMALLWTVRAYRCLLTDPNRDWGEGALARLLRETGDPTRLALEDRLTSGSDGADALITLSLAQWSGAKNEAKNDDR